MCIIMCILNINNGVSISGVFTIGRIGRCPPLKIKFLFFLLFCETMVYTYLSYLMSYTGNMNLIAIRLLIYYLVSEIWLRQSRDVRISLYCVWSEKRLFITYCAQIHNTIKTMSSGVSGSPTKRKFVLAISILRGALISSLPRYSL